MDDLESNSNQQHKPPPEDLCAKDIHYRRLFETARDGILVVDAETGNIIDVNPFLIDTLGYARQDLINKPVWELGFLKNVFSNKNKFEELKQQDYLPRIDLPLETPTHGQLDVHLTGNSYEVEHRKLIQLHFQVVRERKEAESKLLQSEERFHQLIEQAPIGIALSQKGKTVYANSRYLKMFGFERLEELLGTSFLDQIAPQSRVEVVERAMQQEQGETVNPDYEIQGLRKDGSQFPFQATIARVELENEPALIGYFTDVTQRKEAEAKVKESEERFRHIFEMSPISGAITLPDLHFARVNEQMCQMLGYTEQELLRLSVVDITFPDDLSKDLEEISRLASGQIQQYTSDKRYVRKDGAIIWGHLSVSAVRDSQGQPIYYLPMISDINERKNAEEALQTSLRTLEGIINAVPVRIFWKDKDLVYLGCNKLFALDAGFADPKDIVGKNDYQMGWHSQAEAYRFDDQAVILSRCPKLLYEEIQTTPDGNTITLLSSKVPLLDYRDEVIGLIGTYMDITQLKKTEAKLLATEDKFRLLAENAQDLIFRYRLTPPQGYEYVSPSALKIVGYAPEEYYNDPALGLRMVYPEDRFNVEASMLTPEIMPNGPIVMRCIRQDGETIWLEQVNTVIRDADGHTIAIQGIARDITERKAIEEQLGNVLIHQKTILSAVPDIIMEVDKNKVYTWANQAGLDFFGDDVIGKEASYYFVGEQDTYKKVQPVFDGIETNVYLESWQRRKDGQKRLLAWWARSMKDAQGSVIGGLSAANDITDRYNAEQDNQILRQKAEMSTRLAAVGEMAAGIAHEINNPLTGIIGFSELLLERTELPKEVRDDLNIINDGSIRVKEIVSRMLTFARQTKPHKSSVSINELLDNTLELRSYVLKTSNIQVVRDYDPNLPSVTADAGQLQQVFLNIIVNAEYAMKKENGKGTLTIKTREFDRYVSIFISDDGPGMPAEIKAKLFQPFFTTKDPGEGTGLGLSLSHGIIQEHLGNIKLESTPGKGTTFIIELPITPLEIEPENLPLFATVVEPIKRARVLVVDDEPAVRALIKTILTRDGHVVEECGDSSQVIETLKETTFDILLVDLRMPGMNGMELYSEISSLWPKLAHNVIFITGDTSDLNTRQYLSTHQIPFIAKPFDRNTLLSAVNSVLLENQTPKSDPKNPQ